jgi:hypothetical protein
MATPSTTEQSTVPRWRIVGPGLVVAATGVGAADLVATLIAGRSSATRCCGAWSSAAS